MHRCPITYELIKDNKQYSKKGLHLISPRLDELNPIKLSAEEQRQTAMQLASKMSIQGIQSKLSAKLNIKEKRFEITEKNGTYILKPQSNLYPQLPENEDLTMKLAKKIGIETPLHGLLYCKDKTFTYFIKRFDRYGRNNKLGLEDFAQLSSHSRETKYRFSMEKIIPIIEMYCTFPLLEMQKLFTRIIFNFLVGNEDMHLKNYSLISRNKKIELSPAYDFLNSSIAIGDTREEIALPLNGKKNNLTRKDLIDYYAVEKLRLNKIIIEQEIEKIAQSIEKWLELIDISFLNTTMKEQYKLLLMKRWNIISGQ